MAFLPKTEVFTKWTHGNPGITPGPNNSCFHSFSPKKKKNSSFDDNDPSHDQNFS